VVSDTSPLRALQALGRVALIEDIYGRVLVPPTVVAELAVDAPAVGTFQVTDYPFLVVQRPRDRASVARLIAELNAGEAEALALAVEIRADAVLIEETAGRRVAARLGFRTVGVLALLVQAKGKGLVSRLDR
jgi:predicted nucleic acid-binding protein